MAAMKQWSICRDQCLNMAFFFQYCTTYYDMSRGPWLQLVGCAGLRHIKPHWELACHDRPKSSEAVGDGPGYQLLKPKPLKAEALTRLSGQAGPGNHYAAAAQHEQLQVVHNS